MCGPQIKCGGVKICGIFFCRRVEFSFLFADHKAQVIGAAHAGWRGAIGGVIENTVRLMEENGAERGRIAAAIGGPKGAVAAALVTGKRGLIPEETNEDLRAAGIYHVVSISGLHMMLAASLFLWSLRAFLALFPTIALRRPSFDPSRCHGPR